MYIFICAWVCVCVLVYKWDFSHLHCFPGWLWILSFESDSKASRFVIFCSHLFEFENQFRVVAFLNAFRQALNSTLRNKTDDTELRECWDPRITSLGKLWCLPEELAGHSRTALQSRFLYVSVILIAIGLKTKVNLVENHEGHALIYTLSSLRPRYGWSQTMGSGAKNVGTLPALMKRDRPQ